MAEEKKLGIVTTASLVISAMIGTGVFTSLGYQVIDIKSGFSILSLWVLGGVIAFCGAVSYAELGATFKRSGGEYNLLKEIYHPSLGFVAGWVSVTVGFAAPASLAAMALASYLNSIFPFRAKSHTAAVTILVLSIIHMSSVRVGSAVQSTTTILKVVLILIFIIFGFGICVPQTVHILPQLSSWTEIVGPSFAISLVYVSYAYTGWNSSIYVIDEMKSPSKDLPKSLFLGTLIVMILYIFLNYIFLYTVPLETLAGQIEVGFLSGQHIFGEVGGIIMALAISILLVSTVSAYVFLGPRVSKVMGQDIHALKILAKTSPHGIPVNAFLFSTALSLLFIYSSTFEQVLLYTTFLLIFITTITVAGVFVLRLKKVPTEAESYKTWGYPVTPIIFVLVNLATLLFVMVDKPTESMISIGILVVGLAIYYISDHKKPS